MVNTTVGWLTSSDGNTLRFLCLQTLSIAPGFLLNMLTEDTDTDGALGGFGALFPFQVQLTHPSITVTLGGSVVRVPTSVGSKIRLV